MIASSDLALSIELEPWESSKDHVQSAESLYQNDAELGNNGTTTNKAPSRLEYHSAAAGESDYWPLATLFPDSSEISVPDVMNLHAPHEASQRFASSLSTTCISHAQRPKDQTDQLRSFPCPHPSKYTPGETCDATFSQRRELDRHSRTVHPRGEDPIYWCRCFYQCARKDNYVRHLKKCTGRDRQWDTYGCVCGFLSVTKNDHLVHLRGCRRSRSVHDSGERSEAKRS